MATGDLTDLATVKSWLSINATTSDGLLQGLITAASAFIANYLNRNLMSAAYVETVQGAGHDFMLLRQGPVSAVASVAWQGTTLTTTGDPIAGANGFYIDTDDQLRTLRLVGYCFPFRQAVRVSYTAGYATPPPDIAQACIELVGETFKRKDRIGINSQTLGGQEMVSYIAKSMNATTAAILAQYQFVSPR